MLRLCRWRTFVSRLQRTRVPMKRSWLMSVVYGTRPTQVLLKISLIQDCTGSQKIKHSCRSTTPIRTSISSTAIRQCSRKFWISTARENFTAPMMCVARYSKRSWRSGELMSFKSNHAAGWIIKNIEKRKRIWIRWTAMILTEIAFLTWTWQFTAWSPKALGIEIVLFGENISLKFGPHSRSLILRAWLRLVTKICMKEKHDSNLRFISLVYCQYCLILHESLMNCRTRLDVPMWCVLSLDHFIYLNIMARIRVV